MNLMCHSITKDGKEVIFNLILTKTKKRYIIGLSCFIATAALGNTLYE